MLLALRRSQPIEDLTDTGTAERLGEVIGNRSLAGRGVVGQCDFMSLAAGDTARLAMFLGQRQQELPPITAVVEG